MNFSILNEHFENKYGLTNATRIQEAKDARKLDMHFVIQYEDKKLMQKDAAKLKANGFDVDILDSSLEIFGNTASNSLFKKVLKELGLRNKDESLCESEEEITINDFIDSESLETYSPEIIAKKYNIKFISKEPVDDGANFTWKGTRENLNKYLDAYGGPDADELIIE